MSKSGQRKEKAKKTTTFGFFSQKRFKKLPRNIQYKIQTVYQSYFRRGLSLRLQESADTGKPSKKTEESTEGS